MWDRVLGAAALDAGGVVLAGYSKGNWSGTSKGSNDFTAVELDLNGTVLWRWQVIQKLPCVAFSEYSGRQIPILTNNCSA